jgi:uncharacterized repeat protein (TIGR01451 family)
MFGMRSGASTLARRTRRAGILPWTALAGLVLLVVVIGTATGSPAPSAVTEINPVPTPPVKFGGKIDALAVDPVNAQNVFAASELGGLYHSTDQGQHWTRVNQLQLFAMGDVEFAPTDSSLVIATADYDGRQISGGGIWRSTDGGATWSKPATADPGCTSEPSAHGIAIAPTGTPGSIRIWVADTCGISFSSNSGATWVHFRPNGIPAGQLWDVQARDLGGGVFQVDACGDFGYTRSTTGGAAAGAYAAGTNNPIPGTGFGPCTLATAPQDANTVYISYFSGTTPSGFCQAQVDESTDGGNNWEMQSIGDQNCRFPFVVTHPALDGNANNYEVFAGTSVRVRHQTCDSTVAARCAPGTGNWPTVDSGAHPDPSDIAFDTSSANGCPILLADDGGIDRTTVAPASCATSFNWADSNVGNHSLWVTGFSGTVDIPGNTTELYAGTQDNGAYYTNDGGASYTQPLGADVYDIFTDHNAPARVLYRQCFGCGWGIANPGITGAGAFSVPPGDDVANAFVATQFGPQSYAFITRDGAPPVNTWRLWVTTNEGGSWAQMGPTPLPGVPSGPLVASGPAASPTFYVRLNGQINRIQGPFTTAATVTPANAGLISPGILAVDPVDPNRLYTFDSAQGLMRSINGGGTWTLDSEATSLMRHGTQFKLSSGVGALGRAITFDGNSPMIVVGTETAGIILSVNDGDTWFNLRGSEFVPRPQSFFFDERQHTIYVGTAGRGLWRLDLPNADLRITKSDSPDPVNAGEELFYTLTVTNDGPDVASAITVTDTLPSQVDFVTSTIPCTHVSGTVTCAISELASGESKTFQIKVHVKTNAAAGGPTTIVNNATVSSNESLDSNLVNNTASEPTIVEDLADLEITKLCKPDTSPAADEPITCTIFVDNHGPSDARGVVVTDTILAPGSFTISTITSSQGTCTGPTAVTGGQRFVCNLGVLQAATTTQVGRATITYTVSSADGQDLNNVATVRSDTPDPDTSNNSATVTLTVASVANLSLTKSDAPDPVVAGTPITWSLTVSNSGPSKAVNVVVADNVPAGVVVTSITGSGASCVSGVPGDPFLPATCNFGTLNSGTSRTMTINARVKSGTTGILENDARASSDTFDRNNSNNLATTFTDVSTSADLALTFTSDSPTTKPSSTIHYKLTVRNLGPSDAQGVVATVTLPPPKSGYYLRDDGGCTLQNATLTCPIGTFVAGAPTRTIFIDWFVQGSKFPIVSSATVGSDTSDPVPGNNSASVSVAKK